MPLPDSARPAGLKRTRLSGRWLNRANRPLLRSSAQSLFLPGTCVGCSNTLCACAQKAVSCTKSCSGQELMNILLRLASVAELSVLEGVLNE